MSRPQSTSRFKRIAVAFLALTSIAVLTSSSSASAYIPIELSDEQQQQLDDVTAENEAWSNEYTNNNMLGDLYNNELFYGSIDFDGAAAQQVLARYCGENYNDPGFNGDCADALAMLPAYRWHGDGDLYSRCDSPNGWFDISGQAQSFVCNFSNTALNGLMGITQWFWSLSLNSFRFALTAADHLQSAAGQYLFNPIFSAVYETGVSSGIIVVVALLIIFAAFRAALGKNGARNGAIRILLIGFLRSCCCRLQAALSLKKRRPESALLVLRFGFLVSNRCYQRLCQFNFWDADEPCWRYQLRRCRERR